jgi:predicted PurR-regulated permease PerM/methanogenic corrinoid protein MtbC1
MAEAITTQSLPDDENPTYPERDGERRTSTTPIVAIIVATGVLYFASEILLPIAMASMMAVIFSPVASRLERYIGRVAAAGLVVMTVIAAAVAIGYFIAIELTATVDEISEYSHNIAVKIASLENKTPAWLQRVQNTVKTVQEEVQKSTPQAKHKAPTIVLPAAPASPELRQLLKPVLPILSAIAEALLIIVLLFFLLYGRNDLRDRLVRLAARARITISSQAIDAAGNAVSHYLLLFSMINLGYGIAIAIMGWLLGLPNPELWGALACLLRFVPYVGAITSAVLPSLVALAVFPGWSKSVEVFGSFVVLDQIAAQLIEPFLIGHGIGVSPVALLISAMYWAWLWGPAGLILSVPLTARLKVAGDYIEPFDFFSILFGAEASSDNYQDFYQRLLEHDKPGARTIALRYCDGYGLEATFDDVLIPAIIYAGQERAENHISAENVELIVETIRELIADLSNRVDQHRTGTRLKALGICPSGEQHNLGLRMLIALLREDGVRTWFVDSSSSDEEWRPYVRRFAPDVVCISCTDSERLSDTVEMVRGLKADWSRMTIIAGGAAAEAGAAELLEAGCTYVCASRNEGHRVVRAMLWRHADASLPANGRRETPRGMSESLQSTGSN